MDGEVDPTVEERLAYSGNEDSGAADRFHWRTRHVPSSSDLDELNVAAAGA
jgi:hypothetical protein